VLSVVGHLAEAGTVHVPPLGSLPFHAGLATVALVGPGRPILIAGWRSARMGVPTMDTFEPWCWKCLPGQLGRFGLASGGLALLL
jgi:hypothetical protein